MTNGRVEVINRFSVAGAGALLRKNSWWPQRWNLAPVYRPWRMRLGFIRASSTAGDASCAHG